MTQVKDFFFGYVLKFFSSTMKRVACSKNGTEHFVIGIPIDSLIGYGIRPPRWVKAAHVIRKGT